MSEFQSVKLSFQVALACKAGILTAVDTLTFIPHFIKNQRAMDFPKRFFQAKVFTRQP